MHPLWSPLASGLMTRRGRGHAAREDAGGVEERIVVAKEPIVHYKNL